MTLWSADLVEMQKLAKQNKGYRYVLMVINVFSKYGLAKRCLIPLLNPGVDGRQNNVDKPSKYSKEPPSVNPPNSLHIWKQFTPNEVSINQNRI